MHGFFIRLLLLKQLRINLTKAYMWTNLKTEMNMIIFGPLKKCLRTEDLAQAIEHLPNKHEAEFKP
jgi:hypothetical protein